MQCLFHLMFFPAACFLSGKEVSVVAVVACITAIERGVLNLLPYPVPRQNVVHLQNE